MQIGTMHPKTNHVGNQLGPSALGTTTMQSPIPHKAEGDHILRPQSVPLEHDAGIGPGHPRIGRLPRVCCFLNCWDYSGGIVLSDVLTSIFWRILHTFIREDKLHSFQFWCLRNLTSEQFILILQHFIA